MKHSSLLETQQRLSPHLVLTPAVGDTWLLPDEYSTMGSKSEYQALHRDAGMIDRSWRSVLRLTGADCQTFLQGMVTNEIVGLAPSRNCRAAFLDTTGHILADVRVHNTGGALLLETDPRTVSRLAQTLDLYLIMEDVQIADVSAGWAIVTVSGQNAEESVNSVLETPLPTGLPSQATLSVTCFGGEPGLVTTSTEAHPSVYDLWLPAEAASAVWERLLEQGVQPVGEHAADIVRVEAGEPVWGRELTEAILLPETDLPEIVSYTKGCYVGQEIIARLHARGHTNRLLRGILLSHEAPIPHVGDLVCVPEESAEAGREIGRVTSAVASPRFTGRAFVLAYVRREYAEQGTAVGMHLAQPDGTVFLFPGRVLTRPFSDPDIPQAFAQDN